MAVGALSTAWAIDATAEASYTTPATTPDKRHPYRGNAPKIITESISDEDSIQGTFEQGLLEVPVKQRMEFSPEFDLRLDPLALYLKFLFGSLSTSGAGPYVHTINLNAGDAPSFTGYEQDAYSTSGKLLRHVGCKVKSLTIRTSKGNKATFIPEIIGSGTKTEQTVALPALSSTSETILTHPAISAFTINAVDYKAQLEDLTLKFENLFAEDDGYGAGSTAMASCERTGFAVTGSGTIYHSENSLAGLRALAEAKTLAALVLTGTLSTHSLQINIYKAAFDAPEVQGGRGKLKLPFSFKAHYSTSDSKAAQVVVTNGTTVYT